MPRPKLYDDDLRARLVTAAAARLADGGTAALSLRALARDEGTSTNAVYTLFGSKEELVAAVLSEAVDGFTGAQESVRHTDDALADLGALGEAYRTWVLAHPALYAVLMAGHSVAVATGGAGWTADRTVQPLLHGVRRALDVGALVGGDAEEVAITLWAGVHGMVTLETALWGDLPLAERERRFGEHLQSLASRWLPDVPVGQPGRR